MTEELINPVATDAAIPESETADGPAGAVSEAPAVQALHLGPLTPGAARVERGSLDLILDVDLEATVELGRAKLSIREILGLGPGSVVELDKVAGEPADLLINGSRLARGEIVVIDDDFGLRITEILTPTERLNSLR